MAKRKEGSLKGKGFAIFFQEKTEKGEGKTSKSPEFQKSKILEVENFEISKGHLTDFPRTTSRRLKNRKRSKRVWQRTIYLTDEEERTLLKLKAKLFEHGYDAEYSEIIGKAILNLAEKLLPSL